MIGYRAHNEQFENCLLKKEANVFCRKQACHCPLTI